MRRIFPLAALVFLGLCQCSAPAPVREPAADAEPVSSPCRSMIRMALKWADLGVIARHPTLERVRILEAHPVNPGVENSFEVGERQLRDLGISIGRAGSVGELASRMETASESASGQAAAKHVPETRDGLTRRLLMILNTGRADGSKVSVSRQIMTVREPDGLLMTSISIDRITVTEADGSKSTFPFRREAIQRVYERAADGSLKEKERRFSVEFSEEGRWTESKKEKERSCLLCHAGRDQAVMPGLMHSGLEAPRPFLACYGS